MTDVTTEKEQRNESSTTSSPILSTNSTRTEILINAAVPTDGDNDSKRIHEPKNDLEASSDSKRVKGQVWLQYRGKRHTRIGNDYQVNLLPKPSE